MQQGKHSKSRSENFGKRQIDVTEWLKITLAVIIFTGVIVFERSSVGNSSLGGVLAQIQVMVSIYLGVSLKAKGFIIGIMLNLIFLLLASVQVIGHGDHSALPGMIIPISTIITMNIIALFGRKLSRNLEEVTKQKNEISVLNEEVINQNSQLVEYNRMLKLNEEKLNDMAFRDPLTELPNRKMIAEVIEKLIENSVKELQCFAVVFIDLDNFKAVNDTKGHYTGDLLLKEVSLRLKNKMKAGDIIGRLGGDEFAMIVRQYNSEESLLDYLDQIRRTMLIGFLVEEVSYHIAASLGVAQYPKDGSSAQELLKWADMAMYVSKGAGGNSVNFFHHQMQVDFQSRVELKEHLKHAVDLGELFLMYQPQFHTLTGKLRGFEALVRWRSPGYGIVSPMEFIPIAEETGDIVEIGKWVLQQACKMIRRLKDSGADEFVVAVNISAIQFVDPEFISMVEEVLSSEKISGEFLELEITETVCITALAYISEVLGRLKALGIQVAMDDFGTGYSSLNYIQKLPIDVLKIDKTFLDDLSSSKPIIGCIIELVHHRNILVVAEGVENEEQLSYLLAEKCDFVQGFLFSKPVPEEDAFQCYRNGRTGKIKQEAELLRGETENDSIGMDFER